MTPAARVNALIELIATLIEAGEETPPADRLLQRYLRARRYFGAADRRALTQDYYSILRSWEPCRWRLSQAGAEATARTLVICYCHREGRDLAMLFSDEKYGPGRLNDAERLLAAELEKGGGPAPQNVQVNCPAWAEEGMRRRFGDDFADELAALNRRAPAVIRTNRLKMGRDELAERLHDEKIPVTHTRLSETGLVIAEGASARNGASYKKGLFEFQDEGSQIVARLLDARMGMQVCDYCAGTGGKTLALAAAMQNRGQIFASDVSPGRLKRLARRVQRAGVRNTQTVLIDPDGGRAETLSEGAFDRVLVDAPCSGTGSWRRQPELRFRMDQDQLARVTALQDQILDQAGNLVAPGGMLLFATCSLLPAEGEERIAKFMATHGGWRLVDLRAELIDAKLPESAVRRGLDGCSVVLSPHTTGTDGFFIAAISRN